MAVTWKINGTDITALGFSKLTLKYANQQPDELSFEDPAAEFDSALRYAIDAAITLTRTEPGVSGGAAVTWFVGAIRETPRSGRPGGSKITYVAKGPWQWLERISFLQTFKTAADPTNIASALVDYLRGRVIIGQKDDGTKVATGATLGLIVDFAVAAYPTYFQSDTPNYLSGSGSTLPWDEAVDLSVAEAISRTLQFFPDAVCWFDYTQTPPKLKIDLRANLPALSLPVTTPGTSVGDPFEQAQRSELEIRSREDLQRTGVYLVYLFTNRTNDATWETTTIDDYPHPVTPTDPNAIVRTINLAGSVATTSWLTQTVSTTAVPASLVFAGELTSAGGTWAAVLAWWQNHARETLGANVTVKAFRVGTRTKVDGTAFTAACANELVKGAVTDWMENNQGIQTEEQLIKVGVVLEVTDPQDATKKERVVKNLVATIKATNASSKTYSIVSDSSFTAPEATPVGLAQAIYNTVSVLQWDGWLGLTERDPSYNALVGNVLNLTGGLAAWTTMKALIQSATIDITTGATRVVFGPPRHLSPDDIAELYRVNRNRRDVASWSTRTTGKSGSPQAKQGLALHHPATPVATAQEHTRPRVMTKALTMAGVVPTATEVATALAAGWTAPDHPIAGDQILLTVGGVPKLKYLITLSNIGTSGIAAVTFNVSSQGAAVAYWGFLTQMGIF